VSERDERISIRRISASDGPLLREVRLRCLEDAPAAFGQTAEEAARWSMTEWQRRARQASRGTQRSWLLARRGDQVIGLVHGRRRGAQTLLLFSMWVDPQVRRTGVGRRLIEKLEVWARAWGAQETVLWVFGHNQAALDFYGQLGFELIGQGRDVEAGSRAGALALSRIIGATGSTSR
jgi:GNAT superfamily N-acetyltransferase